MILQAVAATREDVSLLALANEILVGNTHSVEAHLSIVMNRLQSALETSLAEELRLNVIAAAKAVAKGGVRRIVAAEWNEEDHPRDDQGQFSSGGGAGAASTSHTTTSAPLTEHETAHVREYQNGSSLNGPLREGRALSDQDQRQLQALDSAMANSALSEDKVLYRGVNSVLLDLPDGATITDKGFVSTSTEKWVAEGFGGGRIIEIRVPKGTRALDINASLGGKSSYPWQKEILLNRGHTFKVGRTPSGTAFLELVK